MKKSTSIAIWILFVLILSGLIFLGYGIIMTFGLPWPGPPSKGSVAAATGLLALIVSPVLTIITLILFVPYAYRNIGYGRMPTAPFKTTMIIGVALGFVSSLLLLGPSLSHTGNVWWGVVLSSLLVTIALGSSFVGLLRFLRWRQ